MAAVATKDDVKRREHELLSLRTGRAALARNDMISDDDGAFGALRFRLGLLLEVMGMFEPPADMVAELLFGLLRPGFGLRVRLTIVAGPLF